jgi:DNA-binding transcriptional LysR family regulator
MDLLAALRVFVRVAEMHSFSAVARDLGLNQPAVSRQVAALEQHFGVRLVHRTTRSLALTEDGEVLLAHARRLEEEAEALEGALARNRDTATGHVRVGTTVAFGLYITPRLPEFLARHPGLSVELVMRDQFPDMVTDALDLLVRAGEERDSTLVARSVGSTSRVAIASPAYIAQRGTPESLADLARHDCLFVTSHGEPGEWVFAAEDGVTRVPVSGSFRANNSEAIHTAVLAGLGIALLTRFQVFDDLKAGRLKRVLADYATPALPIHVVYPSRRNQPLRIRATIDFLGEMVRQAKTEPEPTSPLPLVAGD